MLFFCNFFPIFSGFGKRLVCDDDEDDKGDDDREEEDDDNDNDDRLLYCNCNISLNLAN